MSEELIKELFYQGHSEQYKLVNSKEYLGHLVLTFEAPDGKKVFASLKEDKSAIHVVS